MLTINFSIVFLASLIPMIIGALWYHPRFIGAMWMKESGITEAQIKSGSILKIFGVSILFSLMLAISLEFVVIHQWHLHSIIMSEVDYSDPNSISRVWLEETMNNYGNNYRTFKHGAFHGFISGLFTALPIIGIISLFERRSYKYIFIHATYWLITITLMGGVICAFN